MLTMYYLSLIKNHDIEWFLNFNPIILIKIFSILYSRRKMIVVLNWKLLRLYQNSENSKLSYILGADIVEYNKVNIFP